MPGRAGAWGGARPVAELPVAAAVASTAAVLLPTAIVSWELLPEAHEVEQDVAAAVPGRQAEEDDDEEGLGPSAPAAARTPPVWQRWGDTV